MIDEVQHIQQQKITVLSLVCSGSHMLRWLIPVVYDEKMSNYRGCAIQQPSQRQHSCLMMDGEDVWMYYHDDVVEKIDLSLVLKTAERGCALGLVSNWGSRRKRTFLNCPKFPWTNRYITALEFEHKSRKTEFCVPFYDGSN